MSIFLSDSERKLVQTHRDSAPVRPFYWALVNRVERRAASPGLTGLETTADWWHFAAEYLTDAAMVHALKPSPNVDAWLRDAALSIARRPVADWVGPSFRNHSAKPPLGHLETAHLSWALAVVVDLAADVFTEIECEELTATLHERAIAMCGRWLDRSHGLYNWRCVVTAGLAVAAAVVDDQASLDRAASEFHRCLEIFQPDGSYSESLQYGNYAAYCLMLTREALVRRNPELEDGLPLAPYVKKPQWDAASFFYNKPLTGWGPYPRPRSANFNDSAALYRASADFLLHVATRGRKAYPKEAGLARWLFNTLYEPCIEQGPHDRATFGFVNDFGFLTLPLLPQAVDPITPEDAGVSVAAGFTNGDVLARDTWDANSGRTILAVHGAPEPLHGPAHLHGDINSFILVHNRERLLLDPGHSCYRNLIHELEASSLTHNTCTFSVPNPEPNTSRPGRSPDTVLQQSRSATRGFDPETGASFPPVERGGQRLLLAREGSLTVIASEAAALYGPPISEFTRFWFLCGSHALFIVDRITSDAPVKTSWSWLLNNRDDQLDLKLVRPDRLVARRGNAGMKLFHLGNGNLLEPLHAYVHDAYHPRTRQLGEGSPGSGALVRWVEKEAATERTAIHAICVDDPGAVAGWHLRTDEGSATLESPGAAARWSLQASPDASAFAITESASEQSYRIGVNDDGRWELIQES